MKKWIIFIMVIVTFAFIACQKQYLPTPVIDNGHQITMKVAAAGSDTTVDTISLERGVVVNFTAVSNGPKIVSWLWKFEGGSVLLNGKSVEHVFMQQPPAIVSVNLSGADSTGFTYQTTKYFKIVWSVNGLPAVKVISSKADGSSAYDVVLAFNKAGMKYSGNQYFFIGDMTSWSAVKILPADTNYLIVGDSLILPDSGDMGKYVAVRMDGLTPRSYKMGVGKVSGGQQLWGDFYDSTMVHFSVLNNGTVILATDTVGALVPGSMGDQGINPILRFDVMGDTTLVIYTNNEVSFSSISPFVVFQDSNGVWKTPIAEKRSDGRINWGKVSIPMGKLHNNLLVMRFGKNISKSKTYSGDMSSSSYWSSYYLVLKAMFIKTSLKNGTNQWSVRPVR